MKKAGKDLSISFNGSVQAAVLPLQPWEEKKPKRAEFRKVGGLLLDIEATEGRLNYLVETHLTGLRGFDIEIRMPPLDKI